MQKGYQISFFTEQSRRKDGRPMGNWILETAKNLDCLLYTSDAADD